MPSPYYISIEFLGVPHKIALVERCFHCITCDWLACEPASIDGHDISLKTIADIIIGLQK